MVRLATVTSTFHARVIAARLGSEGIVTELRGNVDGPYPVGDVHVFVDQGDLDDAQELLMVDEVEAAFDAPDDEVDHRAPRELWILLVAIVALTAVIMVKTI
jgi:hypothetical protein